MARVGRGAPGGRGGGFGGLGGGGCGLGGGGGVCTVPSAASGGGGGIVRQPQSSQSCPWKQMSVSAPGPPSSHTPSPARAAFVSGQPSATYCSMPSSASCTKQPQSLWQIPGGYEGPNGGGCGGGLGGGGGGAGASPHRGPRSRSALGERCGRLTLGDGARGVVQRRRALASCVYHGGDLGLGDTPRVPRACVQPPGTSRDLGDLLCTRANPGTRRPTLLHTHIHTRSHRLNCHGSRIERGERRAPVRRAAILQRRPRGRPGRRGAEDRVAAEGVGARRAGG